MKASINLTPCLKLTLTIIIFIHQTISAQVGTLNTISQPVAPNAAILGKFVEMPVSNYSGLADINIPLYSFKAKGVTVPISLSYHSSGIKVRDIPGTCGAGFALNAGGVITRIVRGITDGNNPDMPSAYLAGSENIGHPGGLPYPDYRTMPGVTSEYYIGDNNKSDTEFDIFYYNFMGYSGRFTYNKNGQIVMLGVTDLKPANGGSFTFIDPNGYMYEFGGLEATPNSVIPSIKSWYLTRILAPVTNDIVEFQYRSYGYGIYRTAYGKSSSFMKVRYQDESGHQDGVPDNVLNPICTQETSGGSIPEEISNTGGIILEKIIFKQDTVKFYHDSSRADVYKIKLDSIRVSQGGTNVQRIRFTYNYNNALPNGLNKKLLLASLTINDQSPYTFSYYDNYMGRTMPGIFAKGEDFWGFYNGEDDPDKPDGSEAVPRFRSFVYGQSFIGWNSSHRNADWRYGQLGSLKTIGYPTGGRTEIEYEGNEFTEGFTGGYPEDDLSIALLLDSTRTNGLTVNMYPMDYYPSGKVQTKEFIVHAGQTVTVNTSLGLSPEIDDLSKYTSQVYNGGSGYESSIKLYKYNTGTGLFDLLEERAYNPVTSMGLPADDPSFYAARSSYGTSAESHPLSLAEGRYKIEGRLDFMGYGITANMEISSKFNYRRYIEGSGWYKSFIYNAGGIRVKKIKFISPVNSSSFEKTYSYNDGNKSSGWLVSPFANVTSSMYWGEVRNGGEVCPQLCNFFQFHYDNVIPMGNAQGGVIGYSKVTEQMNDGRKKVMYYSMALDGYNNDYLGSHVIIDRLTQDNSAYRGLLLYQEEFNGSSQKVRSVSKNYTVGWQTVNMNLYAHITDIYFSHCDIYSPYFNNFGQAWGGYYNWQTKAIPAGETIKTFTATDSLTESTSHVFASWNAVYPAKTKRITSSGDSTITYFKYPYDYEISGDVNNLAIPERNVYHIIADPVERYTARFTAGVPSVTSAELISYRTHVVQPDTVFNLVSPQGLTNFTPTTNANVGSVKDSRYRRRIIFHHFNNGNVVEQSKEGESKEVLLWGYQHRFIVARVSSSDYTTVKALVDTSIVNNPANDAALRSTLNNIRTTLASSNPKAKVTTYTYEPLKGMTSMTDPRGETTYYSYDTYGKLKLRKDADGANKEKVDYHYKP